MSINLRLNVNDLLSFELVVLLCLYNKFVLSSLLSKLELGYLNLRIKAVKNADAKALYIKHTKPIFMIFWTLLALRQLAST